MLVYVDSFKQLTLNCSLTITDSFKPIFMPPFKEAQQYIENIKEAFGNFNYASNGTFFEAENYEIHFNNMIASKEGTTDSETDSEDGEEYLNNMDTPKKGSTDLETEPKDGEEQLNNMVAPKERTTNSETDAEDGEEHLNNMDTPKKGSNALETKPKDGEEHLNNMVASMEGSTELEKNPTQLNDKGKDNSESEINKEEKNISSSSLKRPAPKNSEALLSDSEKRLKLHMQGIYSQYKKVEEIFSDRIQCKHDELAELRTLLASEKEKFENSEKRTKDVEEMKERYLADLKNAENEKEGLRDELIAG